MSDSTDTRLTRLETELAHQSTTLDELNEALVKQWDQIDRLTRQVKFLKDRLDQLEEDQANPHEITRPPHY